MTAKLILTLSGSLQSAYVPTHDEYGRLLGDEIILRLLKVAVVDLYYLANEAASLATPCLVCGMDDCHVGHLVITPPRSPKER